MSIKLGDRVRFLDEVGEGIVVALEGKYATVLDDEDFEHLYPTSQLVVLKTDWVKEVYIHQPKEQQTTRKEKQKGSTTDLIEVDLHIHHLIDSTSGMSNYDMLKIQLNKVKNEMSKAQKRKVKKLIFIHGVGEGVLKEEVWKLLRNYDKINIYDADYQKYGRGATAVEFYSHT